MWVSVMTVTYGNPEGDVPRYLSPTRATAQKDHIHYDRFP